MTEKDTTKPAAKSKPRLTPKQWAEAEGLWALGDVTQDDLALKFGVSGQAIHIHMKRRGIKRGEKGAAQAKKIVEAVAAASVDDATIYAARIRETKEEHYKMATAIAKMSFSEILEAKRNHAPVSVATNNLKALDAAMSVLKKAREERWAVLGLDRADTIDDDGLPELLISELTASQIDELRSRDFNEFDDVDTVVQIDDQPGDEDDDTAVVEES